jgi:hypothetical protein
VDVFILVEVSKDRMLQLIETKQTCRLIILDLDYYETNQRIYVGLSQQLLVTEAVRSEAWVLVGWLLGSWVRVPLKAWMFVRVFLCCVVMCR